MAVTARLRYEIFRRDDNTCRYCGRSAPDVALTVDHVIPVALGGSDEPANLVTACVDCNAGKASTQPDSETIAEVSADALRWTEALQRAADERRAQIDHEQKIGNDFEAAWNGWTYGDGQHVPMPQRWRESLLTFLSLGLSRIDTHHYIRVAMESRASPDDTFRYWAGCCWRELDRRRDLALNFLAIDRSADGS